MIGNIYEWCWDWYDFDYYDVSLVDNLLGLVGLILCIIWGGFWNIIVDGFCVVNCLNFLFGVCWMIFVFCVVCLK